MAKFKQIGTKSTDYNISPVATNLRIVAVSTLQTIIACFSVDNIATTSRKNKVIASASAYFI